MAQLDEQATTKAPEGIAAEIESHSIDIIPEDERRGKIRSQFMLWFATNANVFNFVLGGFAILFGLNVFWALIALIVGTCWAWRSPRCTPSRGRAWACRR